MCRFAIFPEVGIAGIYESAMIYRTPNSYQRMRSPSGRRNINSVYFAIGRFDTGRTSVYENSS
jgi:hypothetical protein